MSKTKQIEVMTSEQVRIDRHYNKTKVVVDDPDVNDLIASIAKEDLITYIESEYSPEDIFNDSDLERWAEENGYIKE